MGTCFETLGKACGRVWRVWGRANGRLERPKQMAGACGCESCCQLPWKGLRTGLKGRVWTVWRVWVRAGRRQAAGACSCERCCQLPWKGVRKGSKRLKGLRVGRRQARTPLKTDGWGMWLRELLPVALEKPAEVSEGFEGGQTASSNAFKNRWLGHVAARFVVRVGNACRRDWTEGFEGFEWGRGNGRLERP